MPASNQHIIQKVNARLNVGKHEEGNARSERLNVAVERAVHSLAPILDTVSEDITLYIDQVTVDIALDELDPGKLEEKISAALTEKMRHLIHTRLSKSKTESGAEGTFSEEQQYKKVLAFFLKKGRAPWWASTQVLARARDYLDSLTASEWVHFMSSQYRESPSVLNRYVNQWPETSVLGTLRAIARQQFGSESIVSLLNGMSAIDAGVSDPERAKNRYSQGLYEIAIGGVIHKKDERLITEHVIRTWLKKSSGNPNQQRIKLNGLKKYLKRHSPGDIDYSNLLEQWSGHQPTGEERESTREEVNQKEEQLTSGLAESVSVHLAGTVLLHSYLPLLFKRLGYIEKGSFRNQETRERAVCAIYYLATGESEFPEEELGLAKFLCSWPYGKPINRYLKFSSYEKEECDNLLLSVISHWKALKNTSISGLQTSFLQREGILKKEEFGYTLYVEELTHDILLQQLPWSYSVVKLSWMSEMLSVQWRTS